MKTIFVASGSRRIVVCMAAALFLGTAGLWVWRSNHQLAARPGDTFEAAGLRFHFPQGLQRDFGVLERPELLRFEFQVTNVSPHPIDLSTLVISPPCVHARLKPSQKVLLPGHDATLLIESETGVRPGPRSNSMNVAIKKQPELVDAARNYSAATPTPISPIKKQSELGDAAREPANSLFMVTLSYDVQTTGIANWELAELDFGRISAGSEPIKRQLRLVVQDWSANEQPDGRVRVTSASPHLTIETGSPQLVPGQFGNRAHEYVVNCTLDPHELAGGRHKSAIVAEWGGGVTGLWATWQITEDIEVVPESPITFIRYGDKPPSAVLQFISRNGRLFEVRDVDCEIAGAELAFESAPDADHRHMVYLTVRETKNAADSSAHGRLRFLIRWSDGTTEYKELPCVIKGLPALTDSD